jgi:hypothetical protein
MHYVAFRLDVSDGRIVGRAFCGPVGNTGDNDMSCIQGTVIDSFAIGTGPMPADNRAPVAALALRSTAGAGEDVVTADASASADPDGDALSYRFDFGDGTSVGPQSAAIVTHAYAPGTWSARVIVSDGRGGADTASAQVSVAGNLARNPSFEVSTTGWNANGTGAALARVAGGRQDGFCAELTGAATTASFGLNDSPNCVAATTSGARYRFAAWVRSASHRGSATIKVREYLAGVQQGPTWYSPPVDLSPEWQPLTLEVTAATTGGTLDLQVIDRPIVAGEVFQVDDVAALFVPTEPPANQPPVAALAMSEVFGVAPLAVSADASGSSDPEGGPLTYTFDFGDGGTAGPQAAGSAAHVYAAGAWTARVIVTDAQGAADTASVAVTAAPNLVRNPSFVSALTGWNANGSGAPTIARVPGGFDGGFCAEARAGASLAPFGINDAPNWVSPHGGAGARHRFSAWVRSASHAGRAWIRVREYLNGVQVGATLTSPMVALSPQWQQVSIEVVATVAGGTLDMQVVETPLQPGEAFQIDAVAAYLVPASGASAAVAEPFAARPVTFDAVRTFGARLHPNPPGTHATLELSTTRPGPARVHLFDTQGRVVRTLLDQAWLPAGRHPLRFEVRGPGLRLSPGMYFYRVLAGEGRLTGKFTVLE